LNQLNNRCVSVYERLRAVSLTEPASPRQGSKGAEWQAVYGLSWGDSDEAGERPGVQGPCLACGTRWAASEALPCPTCQDANGDGPDTSAMSDADLLRRAAEETHDTGEGCSHTVAVELGRRGLVEWESDDEYQEGPGAITAKGRAALAEPHQGSGTAEPNAKVPVLDVTVDVMSGQHLVEVDAGTGPYALLLYRDEDWLRGKYRAIKRAGSLLDELRRQLNRHESATLGLLTEAGRRVADLDDAEPTPTPPGGQGGEGGAT
jgi:hypothetical protein